MTTMLVASTGGHLNELVRLAPRFLEPGEDVLWVTNETVQSTSLLAGRPVAFVPYAGSRNVGVTARNAVPATALLRRLRPDRVVSTGSGIALSFLPPARALGIPAHYVESGTRVAGPSLTGRILERVPGVHRYTQHEGWAGRGWRHAGSILDGFTAEPGDPAPVGRVVVTLGSWKQSFRGLVERLAVLLPPEADVLWQTGHTDVTGLVARPTPWVPARDLGRAVAEADLVVTHAGMGATLDALDAGKLPVVVPRRSAHGEQVDDHQVELARELHRRGLAVVRLPETLTAADLRLAAGRAVRGAAQLPPFALAS